MPSKTNLWKVDRSLLYVLVVMEIKIYCFDCLNVQEKVSKKIINTNFQNLVNILLRRKNSDLKTNAHLMLIYGLIL